MVQFLSINFFSWISSIFVGFFKSSRFFVSPCTKINKRKICCILLVIYIDVAVELYILQCRMVSQFLVQAFQTPLHGMLSPAVLNKFPL